MFSTCHIEVVVVEGVSFLMCDVSLFKYLVPFQLVLPTYLSRAPIILLIAHLQYSSTTYLSLHERQVKRADHQRRVGQTEPSTTSQAADGTDEHARRRICKQEVLET
jgi:hypothetical protein